MKKRIILLPLVALLIYVVLTGSASGPAQFSGTNGTGSQGTTGCSCHNVSSTSTTTVLVELLSGTTPVTAYVGGTVYTIRITGTQTSGSLTLPRFGFQISAVKLSGAGTGSATMAGTFGSAPGGTHIFNFGGTMPIFEQTSATTATTGSGGSGTTYVQSISWTAPVAGTGDVKIYGLVNAVNGNSVDDVGDKWNNTSITVPEAVGVIGGGSSSVCVGATTTYSCTPSGGTWSSGSTGIATVGSTGIVTGVTPGTAVISYNAGVSGVATRTVTVLATPSAITGTPTVCVGSGTTLTSSPAGGTWASSATGTAIVSGGTTATNIISGVAGGVATISYTIGSCSAIQSVTVNPLPAAGTISGPANACIGSPVTLTESVLGGTWTVNGITGTATIGASSGVITGVSTGTVNVTYVVTSGAGCSNFATKTMTVSPTPSAISGTMSVCSGLSTTLSDATSSGTWTTTAGTGSVSLVPSGTTVAVTGSATGTATVSYALSTGCAATAEVTVNPLPAAGTVSGGTSVCLSNTKTLTSTVSGGVWTSTASGIASVGSASGIVTGAALGTATINYTVTNGFGCTNVATSPMTVNPNPSAISGTLSACEGLGSTLTATPGGGTWNSSTTNASVDASGNVTGITAGTSLISYSLGTGCMSTATYTVNALPTVTAVSGPATICLGSVVTYTDATAGGTWSTTGGTGSVAIAGSGSTATVTGLTLGTANITYSVTNGFGCTNTAIKTVTVIALPAAIGGTPTVCAGATTVLSDASGSGTWSSSASAVASVTSPGSTSTVSGVASGTADITFTLTSTGCARSINFTVNPVPTAITGSPTVCVGVTVTLNSTPAGGTWTSSNPTGATVGSASGIVTGMAASVPTITYMLSTGCKTTRLQTVNPSPAGISGVSSICVGSSSTLTDGTPAGTWSSSSTGIATIGSTTGVTNGVAVGTVTITYTLTATGCFTTKTITINLAPTDFSGTAVCAGSTITLTSTPTGGVWSTTGTSTATVGSSSGIVTGVASGVTNITYTAGGCSLIRPQTVMPVPASIGGLSTVCEGATTALTDATGGGTWSSTSTGTATVGSTGIVAGVAAGTVTISYTIAGGCAATKAMTVNTAPGATTGTASVCVGQTTTLSNSAGGGTWTSSNTSKATVGSATGVVTGVSATTPSPVITYTLPGGCFVTTTVTVNPLSGITGLSSLCAGTSTTLGNATAGGVWSSSNTSVATIGSTSGTMSALTPGNTTITYVLSSGCTATLTVTVISAPPAISGNLRVCLGFTSALIEPGGGTWTSSATSIATIGSSTGILSGLSVGTTNITYSLGGTGCSATAVATVSPNPSAISGASTVCESSTITLTDPTAGGAWSSSNANASVGTGAGIVTGVTAGTSVISYTLGTGCFAIKTITVNPQPTVIGGTLYVCQSSTTTLTSTPGGGSWLSSATSTATVGATSGIVSGVIPGTSTITYTASGCSRTAVVTVNALPATITGPSTVCVGASITLADATTGGTWSTTASSVSLVPSGTTVAVTGVSSGTATITYTNPATTCFITKTITVNALPTVAAITGTATVCEGATTVLADVTAGGTWSSASTSIATVAGGTVSGVTAGTANITYTVTTSGCSNTATRTVTVNPSPAPITGTLSVCVGLITTLADATGGGTWSSVSTGIATVGSSSGSVSGVAAGTATISYTGSNGCAATAVVTVNPIPSAGTITVPATVCMSTPITLTESVSGGVWSITGITGSAGIGSSTGVVTGTATGTASVTYTVTSGAGCTNFTSTTITVNPLPVAGTITGASSVCAGASITLADAAAGGVWSATNTTATVGTTGVVTGVTAGVDTIKYTVTNSCGSAVATQVVTINPLPVAGTISGPTHVCAGATITLTDAAASGIWSSSNTTVATVGTSGVVTGVSTGIVTISYSVTNICGTAHATYADTVIALPTAGIIVGTDSLCAGDTVHLGDLVTGGTWTTSLGNATVDASGVVTGVTTGVDTVHYTVTTPCGVASASLVIHVRTYASCHVSVSSSPEFAGGIKVYPNPSNGTFTVELPQVSNNATIVIYDVLGKMIDTRVAGSQQEVFNLNNLAAGSYLVKVSMDSKTYRQKIVIW